MWDYVGIVRTTRRLKHARERIKLLKQEVDDYYARFQISKPLLEMRNLAKVADLMVECSFGRRESRGLHYNSDHLDTMEKATDSILIPANFNRERALSGDPNKLPNYCSQE